jgi:hypothetical protein
MMMTAFILVAGSGRNSPHYYFSPAIDPALCLQPKYNALGAADALYSFATWSKNITGSRA